MTSEDGYYIPIIIEESTNNHSYMNKNGNNESGNQRGQRISKEEIPVVYIDIPNHEPRRDSQNTEIPIPHGRRVTVNLEAANQYGRQHAPNHNGFSPDTCTDQPRSRITPQVAQTQPPTPNHFEQTIFYDPFEDRRIVLPNRTDTISPRPIRAAPPPPQNDEDRNQSHFNNLSEPNTNPLRAKPSTCPSDLIRPPSPESSRTEHQLPEPEIALQRTQPSSLDFNAHRPSDQHRVAQRLNLTAYSPVSPDDGFTLTPLPVMENEPPPSYQEVILASRGTATHVVTHQPSPGSGAASLSAQENVQQHPPGSARKILKCQHCNTRVATVVVRQNGCATHVIAMIFLFFCLFPITILVYCGGCLKYENHYCPTCSKLIGYRVPLLGQQLVHVSPT